MGFLLIANIKIRFDMEGEEADDDKEDEVGEDPGDDDDGGLGDGAGDGVSSADEPDLPMAEAQGAIDM